MSVDQASQRVVSRELVHDECGLGREPHSSWTEFWEPVTTKIDSDGVIRVYDPNTNTFGAYNHDGTTRTFVRPSSGASYWAKQPGSPPWTP